MCDGFGGLSQRHSDIKQPGLCDPYVRLDRHGEGRIGATAVRLHRVAQGQADTNEACEGAPHPPKVHRANMSAYVDADEEPIW